MLHILDKRVLFLAQHVLVDLARAAESVGLKLINAIDHKHAAGELQAL